MRALTTAWLFAFDLRVLALLNLFFPVEQARLLIRSRNLAVICCVGLLAACSNEGAAGNTQIDLTIGTDASEELGFEADRVDYRITCAGTVPGTLPIPPDSTGGNYDYDDAVDISGSFEIVDDQDDLTPPVWTTVMNLPPGDCTATVIVFRDGVVVCQGSKPFTVNEDGTTFIEITLLCSLTIDVPDGMFDADGDFQLDVGNECPKLFDFRAIPQVIPEDQPSTLIQTVAQDLDGTCGYRCDPQTCDSENPPNCMPGPDNGLVTTLSLTSGSGVFDDVNAAPATFTCDSSSFGETEICTLITDGDIDCDKTDCLTVCCPFIVHLSACSPGPYSNDGTLGQNVTLCKGATIKSGAVISDNVIIRDDATIEEMAFIGADADIGANATIKLNASIGAETIVGAGVQTEVDGIVGDRCRIQAGATIKTLAVLGDDVLIGAGAQVEDGATIGDRAIIGQGAQVKAGINVPPDAIVPDGSQVETQAEADALALRTIC